ncbi:MAG: AAA family ATPase, partial [Lachnospiraceae bacterium]|nr:AAA family ATPase [Lachnospiraceae bacterium]
MLVSLHVKNLALIREAELDFGPGLNILSGETGAGKSILLGSILLCLGIRSDRELIRRGAESAYVELVFTADDEETVRKLRELDIEPEEGEYRFSRKLTDKKSIARINGETVSLTQMKEAAKELIDLYAQNEQRTLLDEDRYIDLVDEYGREELSETSLAYRKAFQAYRQKHDEVRKLGTDDEERRRTIDFLRFEIQEIERADLRIGEEEELKAEYVKCSNEAAIRSGLTEASELISEDLGETVSRSIRSLQELLKYDRGLESTVSVLRDAESLLQDAAEDVKRRLFDLSSEEDRLPALEARLDEIGLLKRKYGNSVAEILNTLERLRKEEAEHSALDAKKEELLSELAEAKKVLVEKAGALRRVRQKVAADFSEKLVETLKTLNFQNVSFEARVTETNRYTL